MSDADNAIADFGGSIALEVARVVASRYTATELDSRNGHAPDFLGADAMAPFPGLRRKSDKDAVKSGNLVWLKYTNFSILFDRRKLQALVTVTDIDGRNWTRIPRRDGDVWYPDPRIPTEQQPQAKHFGRADPRIDPTKNHYAFGHLVRRLDPCWNPPGSVIEAPQAELETFHLTNASPQVESYNAGIWRNLEDKVLNDLKGRLKMRAVVIAGPIFDTKRRIRIHGEMPVPISYFKIVAWRSDGKLASVGWIQEQPESFLPGLETARLPFPGDEERLGIARISEIQTRSGIDLDVYVKADTFDLRQATHASPMRLESLSMAGLSSAKLAPADALLMTDVMPTDDLDPITTSNLESADHVTNLESAPLSLGDTSISVALESIDPTSRISKLAYDEIVQHETGGRRYYENYYKKRPVWPGGSSGITIGFGYDLGYVTTAEFNRDWSELPAQVKELLVPCVGKHTPVQTKAQMQALRTQVAAAIVEWEAAERVFKAKTLPKFARMTWDALPNCDQLSGDSFGALVSLTFNRGAAYSKRPAAGKQDRWVQMRAIRASMAARNFADIPGHILAMIPLWAGTDIEAGMRSRRTAEAALFRRGLAPAAPVSESRSLSSAELDEAERVGDIGTEPDDETSGIEGLTLETPLPPVSWAPDALSPDYAHLGPKLAPPGRSFQLTADDLAYLCRMNSFDLSSAGPAILFGLRGCVIDDAESLHLRDVRPDHMTTRCVMGVWEPASRKVSVFPGSTVPNAQAVRRWLTTRDAGNLLATGMYGYVTGTHNGKPGCFLLRTTSGVRRTVLVRRSGDDARYELDDFVDPCQPGDNIHPTFHQTMTAFSSLGCQVVVGSATPAGAHSGPWAEFRRKAGLPKDDGVPFTYFVLTGAEARLAAKHRAAGTLDSPVAFQTFRRLRFGSSGPEVARLQLALGITNPDGDFGPTTAARLHDKQKALSLGGSDGIYSPERQAALGWSVL